VLVVQLSYQVFYALSFLGARAVSMAACPPRHGRRRQGPAPVRGGLAPGLFYAVIASLPSLCLLAAFRHPTADLLANGELREANLINDWPPASRRAFAQMAGGIHDFGRQALFSVLDDKGPRIASFRRLGVGVVVAFSTLLLPPDGSRLAGLVICVLAGELASAVTVLARVRRALRPEAFTTRVHLLAIALATLAMFPVIFAGRWLLHVLNLERLGELAVLLGCGALSLGAFLLVVRYIGLKLHGGARMTQTLPPAKRARRRVGRPPPPASPARPGGSSSARWCSAPRPAPRPPCTARPRLRPGRRRAGRWLLLTPPRCTDLRHVLLPAHAADSSPASTGTP